jgi:hypothetical protein
MAMKRFLLVAVVIAGLSAAVQGSTFNVNCDKGEKINKLLSTLTKAGAEAPIRVNVSGTCKESVLIQNFDRLSLVAKPGAVIIGNSKVNAAVTILQSTYVTIEGFSIQRGADGVDCSENSICNLTGLTIQDSLNSGAAYARSAGIVTGCVFQNNPFRGLNVANGSKVLVLGGSSVGNGDGIGVVSGSELAVQNVTIQNNTGDGIRVLLGSTVRLFDDTITGNGGNGVSVFAQSNSSFEINTTGTVVMGNVGNGVAIRDLSFARFFGGDNISTNLTQPDIACLPQFPATRGAASEIGTTNCVEPFASEAEREREEREERGERGERGER